MAGPSQEIVTSGGLPGRTVVAVGLVALFVLVGGLGVYRYARGYWLYRGFPAPTDPAFVSSKGMVERIYVSSAALGGRRQPVDVYLPPGYSRSPRRRYPVFYLLHGFPGRPGAFLQTVRMGVVEDILVARRRIRPVILVMPFGSTGTFTDKEWATACGPTRAGRRSSRATSFAPSTPATGRSDRPARAIGGLSEGGYGAIDIALHHPREFRQVESWSGYEQADPIRSIFGQDRARLDANSPLLQIGHVAEALRAAGTRLLVLLGLRRPPARAEPAVRRRPGAARHPASLPHSPRRAQLGAVARQRRRRAARGSRGTWHESRPQSGEPRCSAARVPGRDDRLHRLALPAAVDGAVSATDRRRAAVRRARPPRLDLARPVRLGLAGGGSPPRPDHASARHRAPHGGGAPRARRRALGLPGGRRRAAHSSGRLRPTTRSPPRRRCAPSTCRRCWRASEARCSAVRGERRARAVRFCSPSQWPSPAWSACSMPCCPERPDTLLQTLAPERVHPLASALVVPLGLDSSWSPAACRGESAARTGSRSGCCSGSRPSTSCTGSTAGLRPRRSSPSRSSPAG